jgi:ABC-type glutathione transport system ATPase component
MRQTKIAISNLSHRFEIDGREVLALADISLDIDDGKDVAICGCSTRRL